MQPRPRAFTALALCLGALVLGAGCGDDQRPPVDSPGPSELQRATAGLTERLESESFVFHFRPGDGARVEVERSEAFHRWAVNVWVSRWNRAEPRPAPHLVLARRLKADGLLYPIESILESADFNRRAGEETVTIAYEQAGAWVSYLVETYGIESMKQIVASIPHQASRDTIRSRFEAVYSLSVADAEAAWLAWLDR